MIRNSETIEIHAPPEDIFDLLHDYSRRLEWDPFLRQARLLDEAEQADVGIRAVCVARLCYLGAAMVTVYTSFQRPRVAAVKMLRGPWFLKSFAASLRQESVGAGMSRVTYCYHFRSRPSVLARAVEPIFAYIFSSETKRRLAALKRFLESPPHRQQTP